MKNTIATSALISFIVALVVGFLFMAHKTEPIEQPATSNETQVGAVSSPDLPFRYLSIGGVKAFTQRTDALTQATTSVICSLPSPAATSTLRFGSLMLNVSTTTISSVSFSNSTKAYTAGTLLASSSVASGAQASLTAASSTQTSGVNRDRLFKPNSFLVVKMLTGKAGTVSPSGTCQASWDAIR